MEKKATDIAHKYFSTFKNDVQTRIVQLGFHPSDNDKVNDLLKFINNYDHLEFKDDDLTKRKRVKNSIPTVNRCSFIMSNGEQCTRKCMEILPEDAQGMDFCGTHYAVHKVHNVSSFLSTSAVASAMATVSSSTSTSLLSPSYNLLPPPLPMNDSSDEEEGQVCDMEEQNRSHSPLSNPSAAGSLFYVSPMDDSRLTEEGGNVPFIQQLFQQMDLVAQEIDGIVYFVDGFGNVYKTEDVLCHRPNPQIIAKASPQSSNSSVYKIDYFV